MTDTPNETPNVDTSPNPDANPDAPNVDTAPDAAALQKEIEALRAKNKELLGKLRAAKDAGNAAATGLQEAQEGAQAAQEALQAERDALADEVRRLRLDGPVAALVADLAIDGDLFRHLFDKHYRFVLADDGSPAIVDGEGNPAQVKEPDVVRKIGKPGTSGYREEVTAGKARPARFTSEDVVLLCDGTPDKDRFAHVLVASRADGGGAVGSKGLQPGPSPIPKPDKPKPQPFGLR
ncbi:MAG: hypothetical protein ACTHXB_07225 [Luteimonas sp.]